MQGLQQERTLQEAQGSVAARESLFSLVARTIALLACLFSFHPGSALAADSTGDEALRVFRALDDKVSDLKKQALEINRDLLIVEEESFIAPTAQLVVFVGLNKKTAPLADTLDVRLEIDGAPAANQRYTAKQIEALFRGGMHRLHLGNLPVGQHTLEVEINGERRGRSLFSQRAKFDFSKVWTRKFVKINIDLPEKEDKARIALDEL